MREELSGFERAEVRRVIAAAVTRGVDSVIALERHRMLWSAQRNRAAVVAAVQGVAAMLEESSIDQLAAGQKKVPATAVDTKRLISFWIREYADKIQRGEVG